MPIDDEHSGQEVLGNATPAGPAASNAALASRFHQMFPVLSETEIDRVRRFGEVRRFSAGELLFQAGEAAPGLYVILLGRVAIRAPRRAGPGRARGNVRADDRGTPRRNGRSGPRRNHW